METLRNMSSSVPSSPGDEKKKKKRVSYLDYYYNSPKTRGDHMPKIHMEWNEEDGFYGEDTNAPYESDSSSSSSSVSSSSSSSSSASRANTQTSSTTISKSGQEFGGDDDGEVGRGED